MRIAVCRLEECTVRLGEFSRAFGYGSFADLDEIVAPATEDTPPVNLEAFLGERAIHFELVERPAAPLVQHDDAAETPVDGGVE